MNNLTKNELIKGVEFKVNEFTNEVCSIYANKDKNVEMYIVSRKHYVDYISSPEHQCNIIKITSKYVHCYTVVCGKTLEFKLKISDLIRFDIFNQ